MSMGYSPTRFGRPSPARRTGAQDLSLRRDHGQLAKRGIPAFPVNALAPDGVIEGIEVAERRFCLGVQWHPEYAIGDGDVRLFAAFVAAAAGLVP